MTWSVPVVLLAITIASASFAPSVRIDHNDTPTNWMESPAITLGPQTSSGQPVYVAFQKDSLLLKGLANASDVMFQKSTDGGRTWLPQDVLVQRGAPLAEHPDMTTDAEGNIYIVFMVDPESTAHNYCCTRSSDGGSTWSTPVNVHTWSSGVARIAADSAGNLLVVWTEGHVYLSVSTDKGLTWSRRIRVDDDTVSSECYSADPCVQPGTNHYPVSANAPYHHGADYISSHAYLYRSTDMGQTFEPGVQLDSSEAGQPHVVADAQHIICDYTTDGELGNLVTEARTSYTLPDTWGNRVLVTKLDTPYWAYVDGSKLAISADGRVHTALMIGNIPGVSPYLAYYVYSSDHGASWSDRALVSDDTTSEAWQEDIAADSAGHAYILWQQFSYQGGNRGQIWFATNNPLALAEVPVQQPIGAQPQATVVRGVLVLGGVGSRQNTADRGELLNTAGRKVMDLRPGANDVRALAPGVYFLKEEGDRSEEGGVGIRKIVITR